MSQYTIKPHVHVPYERMSEHMGFILQNRLNLEIYFSSDIMDYINRDSIFRLRDTINYNPSLSLHAPFMDLAPGAIDSEVRKATMKRFNQMLDIAEILMPKCIVFHSGYEKWKYELKVDTWLKKSLQTWRPLNDRAKDMGVKIAIENIFEDEPTNLRLLMEEMDSENFGICFDTGHCNLFSAVSLDVWLKELKRYILELHLHDNDRSSDQHRPIGDGTFNFFTFFKEINGSSYIYTIEARSKEDAQKSIERFNSISGGICLNFNKKK